MTNLVRRSGTASGSVAGSGTDCGAGSRLRPGAGSRRGNSRLGVLCLGVALIASVVGTSSVAAQDEATFTPTGAVAATATSSPTPEVSSSATPGGPTSSPSPLPDNSERPMGPFQLVAGLHAATMDNPQVGWVVIQQDGTLVAGQRADLALKPASTMKVLTAAAVLDTMGPNQRLLTRVRSPEPPDADGVVQALVLVGAGDPTLTSQAYRTHIFPSRPSTSIEELADRVVAAGVTRVTGNIVGDGSAFGALDQAPGWPDRYLTDYDARHIAGLSIDTGVEVDTAEIDGYDQLIGQRQTQNPPLHAAWEFAQALTDRGVVIDGRVTMTPVPRPDDHQIAWVASPHMETMLQFMLEESDNHLADTLLHTAGLRSEDTGTWSSGGRAVIAALQDMEIDPAGVVVDDGSGLSRLNRVSPNVLANVDRGLTDRHGTQWSEWLATTGADGTLEQRLAGTVADGRFHGKTGSLTDVKARVGHVVDPSGARMHMAVIGNDLPRGEVWRLTVLADDLTLAMLDHLEGCTRVVRPTPTESDGTAGEEDPTPGATPPAPARLPQVPLSDSSVWMRVCE